jgi:uncharacterized membrane protein YGL010W
MTAFVFLAGVDLSPYVPAKQAAAAIEGVAGPLNAAVPAAFLYVFYYLYLAPSGLGVVAASMIMLLLWTAQGWVADAGYDTAWKVALAIHIAGWIAQFYGHGKHEGRSPALLQNLFQVRQAVLCDSLLRQLSMYYICRPFLWLLSSCSWR